MKGVLLNDSMIFSHEGEDNAVNINFDTSFLGIWKITGVSTKPIFRGKGLATEAMAMLLEQAKEKKVKIYPICSFSRYWVDNHPENKKHYATDDDIV